MSSAEPEVVIVLTTLPADADSAALARALVQERLAACVNILPEMTSVYRWEGTVEEARERQVVIKTTARQLEQLHARVRSLHQYDVPEWLVIPVVGGSADYLAWVNESVGG